MGEWESQSNDKFTVLSYAYGVYSEVNSVSFCGCSVTVKWTKNTGFLYTQMSSKVLVMSPILRAPCEGIVRAGCPAWLATQCQRIKEPIEFLMGKSRVEV